MLQLKVTPVVGLPQFTGWSQVAESAVSVSVHFILVYAVSGKHAGNVGRDISEKVSDFYFYDVEQVHDFLQQLIVFAHSQECRIYFSCAVLGRDKSIFATYGGSIFLKREEKSGKILSSDFAVQIVEGTYVENDIFVLTTLQADQFLNEIQLKFKQGYDVDIIITSIVPGLHAQDDSSLSAIVFLDKEKKESLDTNDSTSFIELEEEISKTKSNTNDNGSLADVSFELDSISVPASIISFKSKTVSFLKKVASRLLTFCFGILNLIKNLFMIIWSKIRNIDLTKIKNRDFKSIFLRKKQYISEDKPNKNLLKFVLAILILLIISGVFGFYNYQNKKELDRLSLLLDPINIEVNLAKETIESDPIQARETISSLIEKLSTLENENKDSTAVKIFSTTKQELSVYLESISGREELQELDIFYDLRLAKSDFISTGIDISKNKLVLFDTEMKQILLLDHDTKQVLVRDLSQRETLISAVLKDETVVTLVDGIYKFPADLDSQTELEEVRSLGDSNKTATLLDAYDRFVYVVNPTKRNIYRYSETEDGYSEPVGWMKSVTGLKYDDLLSIAVDGDVWLTTSDGQLKKFSSGREETISLRGLTVPFKEDIYVYTNENLQNLYVLDSANNRVVLLSKDGDFIKEYKSVSLGAASNIAVSEELKKIFVVSGSIIYQVSL
jgi:hypothetical protein